MKISHIFIFSERRAYIECSLASTSFGHAASETHGFPTLIRYADPPPSSAGNSRSPTPSHVSSHSLRSFGPPGIGPGLHDPQPCVLPLYDGPIRGAGNRTRSTRTRSVRTTGILHPGAPCRIRTYDLSNVNRTL